MFHRPMSDPLCRYARLVRWLPARSWAIRPCASCHANGYRHHVAAMRAGHDRTWRLIWERKP